MKTTPNLKDRFLQVRAASEAICKPLATEDYVVQPIKDVSPPKWHLAHTTWFFEQFILVNHLKDYSVFDKDFSFLFNSYYNHKGSRTPRHMRGFMTRPKVSEVYQYREHINKYMLQLLDLEEAAIPFELIEIGLNHEEQHQELLAYDIKYILGSQPTYPSIGPLFELEAESQSLEWLKVPAGHYQIGSHGEGFAYDNEQPQHQVYLGDFEIASKLVTKGDYLEFINAGGYSNFELWHEEGWHFIHEKEIQAPLYWVEREGQYWEYRYNGLKPLNLKEPLCHISFYEAFAYAEWKGLRIPTEYEWEAAADQFKWGQLWEWTQSAYLPYPGFAKEEGALGEYNGKFMLNQNVLRGASVATPPGHSRKSYRNFFHASSRWIFAGLRLAKKIEA